MAEESIKGLIKRRGIVKASITRVGIAVSNLELVDNHFLQIKLRNLKELADKYDDIQTQIECSAKEPESVSEDRVEMEQTLCSIEHKILLALRPNSSPDSGASVNVSTQLQPIKIPTFNGNILDWQHYYTMFLDMIHARADLTDVQKMHYLYSSLKDEPLNIVRNLTISTQNYKVALNLLRERYDNKLLIAVHHIQNILKIKSIDKESLQALTEFINVATSTVNSLNAMQLPVNTFELIFIQFLVARLDANTARIWKEGLMHNNFPDFQKFIEFLSGRRQILENVITTSDDTKTAVVKPPIKFTGIKRQNKSHYATATGAWSNYHTTNSFKCPLCKANHHLHQCTKFSDLTVDGRKQFVSKSKCCNNCLRIGHDAHNCGNKGRCKRCSAKHHTLLHAEEASSSKPEKTYCSLKSQNRQNVLLSTALVDAIDSRGSQQTCRILLDSASQANFCTFNFARKLQLPLTRHNSPISGINNATCQSHHTVNIRLTSRYENFSFDVTCAVLTNITDNLPSQSFEVAHLNIPSGLFLADPGFNESQGIDILLGAQYYLTLLRPNQFTRGLFFPVIQETRLGYILGGNLPPTQKGDRVLHSFISRADVPNLAETMEKFWAVEEVSPSPSNTSHSDCEAHFVKHTTRNAEGRFVVALPRKPGAMTLGDSYALAKRRFLNLEQKLQRNDNLRADYSKFIKEYIDLGHMSPIDDVSLLASDNNLNYYLPHHAVLKHTSLTTKLRVVFDGSAKTTNGVSLNDTLLVGPTVQQDLFSIILRFRMHNYVLVADISKMYRQVLVRPSDCHLQCILWRDSPDQKLQQFVLKTVTYGTACASFLATRCLVQIGLDNQTEYPDASNAIIHDFYVDDLLSGANTVNQLKQLKNDIMQLLVRYGFSLHKWFSNSQQLLPSDNTPPISLSKSQTVRTLGLVWNPTSDVFTYEATPRDDPEALTKRNILSTIAGIYDPLGLIGPVVFLCKHFMQQLWLLKIGWDDPVPPTVSSQWSSIRDNLRSIQDITISRPVLQKSNMVRSTQLLGFADASNLGYACCLYLRCNYDNGETSCELLCSKSRVAPLKQLSLPRGELCACLLLSQLFAKVISVMHVRPDEIRLHSDSMIALHWIHSDSIRWKTFVANRVAEIQRNANKATWYHVRSNDNPADVASRGCLPSTLRNSRLWWHGPPWLLQDSTFKQLKPFNPSFQPPECHSEERQGHQAALTSCSVRDPSEDFSSLHKLIRVYTYCLRFVRNTRTQKPDRSIARITVGEELETLKTFIRRIQSIHFSSEIEALQKHQPIPKQSKLGPLDPFIDESGLLRVGGRLHQSMLGYDNKHPFILPSKSHLTELIISSEHQRLLHAGPQLTHHSLRQRYWILNGKQSIRSLIRKCTKCFRFSCKRHSQLLGQLPALRVSPSRPFLNCAVDYGGPFMIRLGGPRSHIHSKAYVALFICLATRAIHVELVSDLSTEAFIAALRRFSSRRGLPAHIHSDNGTNFKSASNLLHDLFRILDNKAFQSEIQTFSLSQGIKWSFIPPSSPHFGGLWEAGIKSLKHHLRRVIGKTILSFEELYTILTQIEACLNSRPLGAIPHDHRDPSPLTPGHFLIGAPLTAIPDPELIDVPINRLRRWQLLQKFTQSIWKVWSRDYLHQMQQRNKWKLRQPNLASGDLVLIIEENSSPLLWKYGIVTDAHPGPDGLVRVVDVRTANGIFRRPVHKLCLLPKQQD